MNRFGMYAITGAFGYSGRYIAARLLDEGREVITLTNSLARANPFGSRVRAFPLAFDEPEKLAQSLAGVDVLYNTYWVRFNHRLFTHAQAVQNTLVLFEAARQAGVRRIVHVSITNPSEDSPLEYFAGKARLERALRESGLDYSISPSDGVVWPGGYFDQQHRVGVAAVSIFRGVWRRLVSLAADLRRRPGGLGRGGRQSATGKMSSTPSARKHSPTGRW